MFRFALFCLFAHLLSATAAAQQPARIALLIGNKDYPAHIGALVHPHNDIARVGRALRQVQFVDVRERRDLGRAAILAEAKTFADDLKAAGPGAIGFFYYSGHGAAQRDSGRNFLIPVDAQNPNDAALWDSAVSLDEITRRLRTDAPDASIFAVFDACRDELQLRSKSLSKGFVPVQQVGGLMIAFATDDNRSAADSGVYAQALAAEIVRPGLSHVDMFQNVREAVDTATGGKQLPLEWNGFRRRVYLSALVGPLPVPGPPPGPIQVKPPVPPAPPSPAVTLMRSVRNLPGLDLIYSAKVTTPKPEIVRNDGTKLLAVWRVALAYDRRTFDDTLIRTLDSGLSAIAKATAGGITFSTNGATWQPPDNRRVFGTLRPLDVVAVDAYPAYAQSRFGDLGAFQWGNGTDALFKSLHSAVGWHEGNVYVLLAESGGVGSNIRFKAYSVPVEALPILACLAGSDVELTVKAANAQGAALWTENAGVADVYRRGPVSADVVRAIVRGEGPWTRKAAFEEIEYRLKAKTAGYQLPREICRQPSDATVAEAGTAFRRAWLASDFNQPGTSWHSSPERPTVILIAPWFFLDDYNPRGLASAINATFARWLTQDELDAVARLEVGVSGP